MIEAILASAELRARVVAHSQALRRRVLRYLEQVRPPGEERLVLVDLGWRATTQAAVEQLLREAAAGCRTLGLYLITAEPGDAAAAGRHRGARLPGRLRHCPSAPVDAIMRAPEILEQVSMPDHGSQVGLTEDLRPVLADADEPLDAERRARGRAAGGGRLPARVAALPARGLPDALPALCDAAPATACWR